MLDAARLSVLEMRAFLDGAGGVEFGAGDRSGLHEQNCMSAVAPGQAFPGDCPSDYGPLGCCRFEAARKLESGAHSSSSSTSGSVPDGLRR